MLQYSFLAFGVISLIFAVMGILTKRRNYGYILSVAIVVAMDVLCYFLLICERIQNARMILIAIYICHAWLYFTVLWTVLALNRHKALRTALYMLPIGLICVFQTYLVLGNLFDRRIMMFSKHIHWGKTYWVAMGLKASSALVSFNTYKILIFVGAFIIMCAMISGRLSVAKVFAPRYYLIFAIQVVVLLVEVYVSRNALPVWILGITINLIVWATYYPVNMYADSKLVSWSTENFANDMSDGFVLYNQYDDMLKMNDALTRRLPSELTDSFYDRSKLEEWLSDQTEVEGLKVHRYQDDKEEIYFQTKTIEVKQKNRNLGTIFILHDMTEGIMRLRSMEEANRELERAAKMKSDFLANMSHEIRTPMNAVIGMAEIALREKLPPHVKDYIAQIQNSGRNLLNIINDILDYSKIEAGRMEIVDEQYTLVSEISEIANVLETRIGDKPLELFVMVDPSIPKVLEGDSMRIRQVLINLANNAIKFTQKGKVSITIEGEKISDEEVMITCHVKDTGIGIKEHELDKLFESFSQLDSKRNRSVEGTGLGLAISKRLCEAMGGGIHVESEYGVGSDFSFFVPQKIVDPAPGLAVEDPENKYAVLCCDLDVLISEFKREVAALGVSSGVIERLDDYKPSGKRDILFISERDYNKKLRTLLNKYPDLTCVVIINFESEFETTKDRICVLRRPETTMAMVDALNGVRGFVRRENEDTVFHPDFTAPSARILIVDDNEINITIAKGLLKPLKVQCTAALSGKDAIELLERQPFDLVFMDHMMPEMDGVETTRVIRRLIPSAKDTPILALTANVMEQSREQFFAEGMNDFVAKPINVKDIVTKLKRWLPKEKILELDEDEEVGTPEEIISYDGLNSEEALKAIGSASLYNEIVREYYRSGDDRYHQIEEDYEKEDWEGYTIKVHALKSASRQIGADAIGDMAEQMEHAGNARDVKAIHDVTRAMLMTYRALLDRLSKYFPEEKSVAVDRPMISKETLGAILDALAEACDNLDMDAMEEAGKELGRYTVEGVPAEDIDALIKAIEGMDVDVCMDYIGKMRS